MPAQEIPSQFPGSLAIVDPVTRFGLLDLLIVVIVLAAAVHGWRTSGTARLGGIAGTVLGALIGLGVAGAVAPLASPGLARLLLVLLCVIVLAALGAAVLGRIGSWIAIGLRRVHLRAADGLAGAALSALGALLACWLVLVLLAAFFAPPLGTAIEHSAIAETLSRAFPQPFRVLRPAPA